MCWFLPYININQPQVYIRPLPPEPPLPLELPSSLPVMKGKAQGNRSKNDKDLGKSRRDVQISQTDTAKDVLEGVGSSCWSTRFALTECGLISINSPPSGLNGFSHVCTCSRIRVMKVYRQFKDGRREVREPEVSETLQNVPSLNTFLKYVKTQKIVFSQLFIFQLFTTKFL